MLFVWGLIICWLLFYLNDVVWEFGEVLGQLLFVLWGGLGLRLRLVEFLEACLQVIVSLQGIGMRHGSLSLASDLFINHYPDWGLQSLYDSFKVNQLFSHSFYLSLLLLYLLEFIQVDFVLVLDGFLDVLFVQLAWAGGL